MFDYPIFYNYIHIHHLGNFECSENAISFKTRKQTVSQKLYSTIETIIVRVTVIVNYCHTSSPWTFEMWRSLERQPKNRWNNFILSHFGVEPKHVTFNDIFFILFFSLFDFIDYYRLLWWTDYAFATMNAPRAPNIKIWSKPFKGNARTIQEKRRRYRIMQNWMA